MSKDYKRSHVRRRPLVAIVLTLIVFPMVATITYNLSPHVRSLRAEGVRAERLHEAWKAAHQRSTDDLIRKARDAHERD